MTQTHRTPSLTLASATITPSLEPSITRERMRAVMESTAADHPDVRLILFGEVILGWFVKEGETREYQESIAEPIPGPSTQFFADLARKHGVYVAFGMSEKAGEALHNSQVLVSPEGELIAVHRKFWIFNPAFTAGDRVLTTVDIDGVKVALLICADVRSIRILREIRKRNVDLVLAALADYGTDVAMSRIIGTFFDAWAVTANRYGAEDSIQWQGLTTITDRLGRLVQSSVKRECVLVQKIPTGSSSTWMRGARRTLVPFRITGLIAAMIIRSVWSRIARLVSRRKSAA